VPAPSNSRHYLTSATEHGAHRPARGRSARKRGSQQRQRAPKSRAAHNSHRRLAPLGHRTPSLIRCVVLDKNLSPDRGLHQEPRASSQPADRRRLAIGSVPQLAALPSLTLTPLRFIIPPYQETVSSIRVSQSFRFPGATARTRRPRSAGPSWRNRDARAVPTGLFSSPPRGFRTSRCRAGPAVGMIGVLARLDVGLPRVPNPVQQPQHRSLDELGTELTQPHHKLRRAF